MITAEELETMLVEIATGKPPTLDTPEANEMREQLRRECEEIRAQGLEIDIPHEIPWPKEPA